ncbi:uncharacterized protein LOC132745097 isoform X1 [Ruditapes philippinarum]|uniref:uncharacterized protein LOC132745097 isoform X1 n=1 Tax=Ruditapes philippinarum TaxID=129788 RepID=UPI00295C30A3|nr:uncharacterized protein LOC132745097 isoform X1 [Ruditapes philippinarum]
MFKRFCKRNYRLIQFLSFIVFILILSGNLFESYIVEIPTWVRTDKYPPFEPELHEDFQTVATITPRIPHILHQYNTNLNIPISYVTNIKSFLFYNPSWKYSFWTEETSRQLIADRHPSLIPTWDAYANFEIRSSIIRYVLLYEFGGAFSDMKVKCLRSLKRITYKYACVLPARSFELVSVKEKRPYVLSDNVIFCRSKHPFLKQIIDNIPLYQPMIDINDAIGAHFLTGQYMIYNNLQSYYNLVYKDDQFSCNSPFIYRGELPDTHMNAVFVSNSKYFPTNVYSVYPLCQDFFDLSFLQKRGCIELNKRRENSIFAFTYDSYKLRRFEKIINYFVKIKITHIVNVDFSQ